MGGRPDDGHREGDVRRWWRERGREQSDGGGDRDERERDVVERVSDSEQNKGEERIVEKEQEEIKGAV